MAVPSINRELKETLGKLRTEDQRRVLDFARTLAETAPRGVSGKVLLEHLGQLPAEEADRMSQAIEQRCEQVKIDAS